MYSRIETSLKLLNSQNIKSELGELLGPKIPNRGKFILNSAFSYSKKILVKKEEKQSQHLKKLFFL